MESSVSAGGANPSLRPNFPARRSFGVRQEPELVRVDPFILAVLGD
jgi:hypothetical protein